MLGGEKVTLTSNAFFLEKNKFFGFSSETSSLVFTYHSKSGELNLISCLVLVFVIHKISIMMYQA
jgi:hypothetical protein